MIPTIGVMLASYIFTRMVQIMRSADSPATGVDAFTKVAAAFTVLVTLVCVLALIKGGLTVDELMQSTPRYR